jgi:hypothetical protein
VFIRQSTNREKTAQLCRAGTRLAMASVLAGLTATSTPASGEKSSWAFAAPVSDAVGVRAGAKALAQELDVFMKEVLERRDENWKKLQQYILDEREKVEVRGPTGLPVWGQRREFQWFIREGYFVRSPVSADGVTVPEDDRRKYETQYLNRVKAREKKAQEEPAKTESGNRQIVLGGNGVEMLLEQTLQPQFVNSAYFMKFKFDGGRYALAGREKFGDVEVLRIEYYPTKLFNDERERSRDEKAAAQAKEAKVEKTDPAASKRKQDLEKTMDHLMNKNSKVTLWVEPKAKQIVKYVFDNVQMDFLPAAWLLRMEELKASMTMSQPFKDVWLPKDVEFYFAAMLAIGMVDVKFNLDYYDYREATTSARIKGRGGF